MSHNNICLSIVFSLFIIHGALSMELLRKQSDLFPFLETLPDTPRKITEWCDTINLLKPSVDPFAKDWDFGNIGHLDLHINGPFTLHYELKSPTLSLQVDGLLTLGKSNDELGTIAATHGPLTITAHGIDARYGKFYGKGPTLLESLQGDITIGAPTRGVDLNIKQQYVERNCPWALSFSKLARRIAANLPEQSTEEIVREQTVGFDCTLNQLNGAYAACNNILTLRSAANIFIKYGSVWSALKNHLIAAKEIQNLSGKISSHGTTTIEADTYNHMREGAVEKPRGSHDHAQYPGSGPAILESLDTIEFHIKNKIHNLASSIRSGKDIIVNKLQLRGSPQYTEETQNFYTHGNYNVNGNPDAWAHQYHLTLTQSCITQAGDKIDMNLGDFTITGNMSASTITVTGDSGMCANTSVSRDTVDVTKPLVFNVTNYALEQARKPGLFRLGADGSVQTEFPFGTPSRARHDEMVLLDRVRRSLGEGGNEQPAPLNWLNIFNPLSSINLDLFVQQALGNIAGKVSAGKAKGNQLSSVLWKNASTWRQNHQNKAIMSSAELQQIDQSMLLSHIAHTDGHEEQHTLLCIAPQDINPYQSQGDIVAGTVSCITQGNQTHLNDRIVATGPAGITLQSTTGAINLETQKYTVTTETKDCKVVQEIAMPQQQLLALAGQVTVQAEKDIKRTGTAIAAAGNIAEQSNSGAVIKQPLVLQKTVETHHKKRGFFSSSHHTQTSLTHSALSCDTHAGTTLHDKAATTIHAVAPRDTARQTIIYEAPQTNIEGLLLANRTTSTTEKSGAFTASKTHSSKETPFAVQAHIQAPLVLFSGDDAKVNATICARELRDETAHGIQFVAKVAQMLCSEQKLISSPLLSADIGYEAGYETMIPPMLLVEKIVRLRNDGCMHFESAIIDKDRTQIIGNFVETTYQLKHWQRNWSHVSQAISDEALVVVALAVTLATQGAGAEFMAPLLQNITAGTGMQLTAAGVAAFNAGFSAVCSGMGASALKTGDPIGAVKTIASPASLKSLAVTMASAGLCSQLGDMLNIDMTPGIKSLSAHLQEHALRNTVDTLLNLAINNASVDSAVRDALADIPLKAIAAYASNEICSAYMHEIGKQAAQTVVGGVSGFAKDQSRKGFIAGATGALTAEAVGGLLVADAHAISDAAITTLKKQGKPTTPENVLHAIKHEVQTRLKYAKIAAGSVAVLTHQNPHIAIGAATNAIDNDVAIRGTLHALAEYQSLLAAASQAYVTLQLHQEKQNKSVPAPRQKIKHIVSPKKNAAAHDLFLQLLEASTNRTDKRIMQYAMQKKDTQTPATTQQRQKLLTRIINPKTSRLIAEIGTIVRISFIDAVNKTIDTFALIPNPLGIACSASSTGRDLYLGTTTPGEIIYNTALACGTLKGIQLAGKGVKIVYQRGKGMIKNITDKVATRLHQRRYAAEGRVPFVENPQAGTWNNATIAENDLVLTNSSQYENAWLQWNKDKAAPFNVVGHGDPHSIAVDIQSIHPKGLSQTNLLRLIATGTVSLNAVQLARLIRTAPGYVKGQHINLFSCSCGAEANGIAQQLATRMEVPVSAFSKNVILRGTGKEFSTMGKGIDNFGVMETFYPKTNFPYRLVALSLIPAFVLSGDERQREERRNTIDISETFFDRWIETSNGY